VSRRRRTPPHTASSRLTVVCTNGGRHPSRRLATFVLYPDIPGVGLFDGVALGAPAQHGRDGSVRFHPGERAPAGWNRLHLRCPDCTLHDVYRENTVRDYLEAAVDAGRRACRVDVSGGANMPKQ